MVGCLSTLRQLAPYIVFVPEEKLVVGFAKSSGSHSSACSATAQYNFNRMILPPSCSRQIVFVEPPDRCRMTITPPSSFVGVSRLWSYNSPCSLLLLGLFIAFCCPCNKDSWALSQMFPLARVHVLQTFVSPTAASASA